MRILHTGDWHLGRTLLGADLLEHQAAFLDWLVDLVQDRSVDLVVIAGDVYDRAIPPIDAVRMLSRVLERLAQTATVVLTPGNHDSAARLGFGAGVMDRRVRILAEPARIADPVLVDDADGPVAVYGIPYLHPDLTRYALADVPDEPLARSHHAVVRAATERIRSDLSLRGAPAASSSRTPSSAGPTRATASRTSASAVSTGWPNRSSTGSTTSPSGTCTVRSASATAAGSGTPAHRWRSRSASGTSRSR